jgi:hypothetical protein
VNTMKNKQPFYHRVDGLLFTATSVVTEQDIIEAIGKIKGVVKDSVEIEPDGYGEPEPGDPADLM